MLEHGHYTEMDTITTAKDLKKACRFQGNMMPIGDHIMVTRWGWNYDRNDMGYEAHIYCYSGDDRGPEASIHHVAYSAADHEDFTTEAEAGSWAFGMIAAA
ncbi:MULTISPECIES: hypothetical protein [unclassified Corynebacterium]|uniref:Nmad4 family putative nucleotide modification protein n=1 Tax=unclassified Corynebacterium TaxID=2624378 RepID=UPI00211B80AB|nr:MULTISPECIES: hypothetical protein [unclassified Corynebacterium]MCQ9359245.1 hypothetical protein [Corynebacterium sp. 142RC1]MCQ9365386.1 hypothetical protein [Corynebacterium sp. 70RC1]